MFPVIADFGRYKLYSYGLMLFIAFVVGILYATRRGKKAGFPEGAVLDFAVAIIISSLVGSRALYVITHFDEFHGRMRDIVNPFQSDGTIGIAGLVMLGGVVLAIATVVVMAWLRNISILKLLDVFAPSLALGIAIGRIGCLLNGCCFGMPTDLPWGMVFPENCLAGSVFPNQHIHPTQAYAILYNMALFVFLLGAEKKWGRFDGFTSSLFLVGYGILRTGNEAVRWYEHGMKLVEWECGAFTVSQAVSLVMVAAGIILFLAMRNRSDGGGKQAEEPEDGNQDTRRPS